MEKTAIGSVPVMRADVWSDGATQQITFEGETAEHKWLLSDLDPEFPTDWSAYEYLVLEVRPSSPQRFYLRVHTNTGMRALRLQPVGQGVWLRVTVPLRYFKGRDQQGHDLASANNRPRHSYWFSCSSGPFGDLDQVEAIELHMEYPVDRPTLEIRFLGLSYEDPGSEVLEKLPVVDRFGQWAPTDWPGKIRDLDQLGNEWADEEAALSPDEFNRSRYGGYLDRQVEPTGFFHVRELDGKWWFIDPEGYLFLSMSIDVVSTRMDTPITGRESYYAELPPDHDGERASFYTWNLQRRFGDDWAKQWVDLTVRRLKSWGMNTIANWSEHDLVREGHLPYVLNVSEWQSSAAHLGLPDVYSESFERHANEIAARDCAPCRDDPYLLGYFIGNEPPWPGREEELVEMILVGPPSGIQREAQSWLTLGDTPERRQEFVHRAFRRYLEVINDAVHPHDPNHLNLGLRFGRNPGEKIIETASIFDVYSLNVYGYEPTAQIELAHRVTGRPALVGEFHIGVPGNGLSAGLIQARDQVERGVAYRYFVEQAMATPATVGAHWFQWVDQLPTGRRDGENYNIGFVDVVDRPYRELVEAAQQTHKRLYAVHSGILAPIERRPRTN